MFGSRACYTCALSKHSAERYSVAVTVETPEMFADSFNTESLVQEIRKKNATSYYKQLSFYPHLSSLVVLALAPVSWRFSTG